MTRFINKSVIAICLAILFFAYDARAQSARFIRDAEIETLLRDYSNPLLRAAGLAPNRIDIYVIGDSSVNAFVANGQNLYFHTGLLLEADAPNMVIGVIAHEIGHITGGHLARTADAAARSSTPAVLATILGFGSILAGAGDVGIALIAGGAQLSQTSFLSYSRAQEAGADQVALQLLEATQQSAQGIVNLMDKLAGQEVLSEAQRDLYVRSHPLSRDRVLAYTARAQSTPYWENKDSPELVFRHKMVRAKIYGFLDHPQTTLRRFSADDKSAPSRYARAIALYKSARTDAAIALLDTLIADMPDNAYFHELKGQIYYEAGRADDALAPFKRAVALHPDEPLIRIGLAVCQNALGTKQINGDAKYTQDMTAQAISNLKISLRQDPRNTTAFFQLSRAYGQSNDIGRAEWALAEYFALQKSPQARVHAIRALRLLPRDAIEYLRAKDIATATS